ncbi:hypothetical protein CYLTODRAFT_471233 [Cylindrobasidium torrendii FP15055 ss-10]|uniref:Uncharacterized protein n=1 Tax=Cylindrobasidium torrendii FP15055 ss-10 TaxID=1314674 RepID=A0A0D7B1X8_9AGAR|nr:hypothetical protein CYLTODRAFT_471233 [Cylindrobasidium torrendii FP15055 ss-10]
MSSDPRFARLRSDPRFRRPKKAKTQVQVDERFKSVFAGEKKKKNGSAGRVDKYGRPVSDTKDRDEIKRFYRLKDKGEAKEGEEEEPTIIDYARGAVMLESSDEEEEEEKDVEQDDSDSDEADGAFVKLGAGDDEDEINLDESEEANLAAQASTYSKQNPEVETGDRTRRLAAVNLDWDHIRASHLFKICSSLVSPSAPSNHAAEASTSSSSCKPSTLIARGQVLSVRVYPSEFGKERMAKEEKEGPPAELFKRRKEPTEINAKTIYEVGEEGQLNEDALRKYQLDRLRYYYAVIECDTVDAASHIYDELEATEFERSANLFDLRFVPDDMPFDDAFRDEATGDETAPSKPLEFTTDALRHSRVKLTWDDDDPERARTTRRKFTKEDIEKNNFRAYIASSSEDEDEEEKVHKSKSKDKLRALLLGGNTDEMPEGWNTGGDDRGSDMDMEITFTPGLSTDKADGDETTIEKYKRKMREKRKAKKEEKKGEQPADDEEQEEKDEFFGGESSEDEDDVEELPQGSRSMSINSGKSVRIALPEDDDADLGDADVGGEDDKQHFDMKAILKAEKGKKLKKKRKGSKKDAERAQEVQPDFAIDVADSRFSVLHEDPTFAIDPSNPHFKRTSAMSALLEEGTKQRHKKDRSSEGTGKRKSDDAPERKLDSLVESVKRKSMDHSQKGRGKRQKTV